MRIEIDDEVAKQLITIIDMCATRGAFRGEELELVGQIRRHVLEATQKYMPKEKVDAKVISNAK